MINPPTCCPKMHQKKYKEKYKRWDKCLWNEGTCMEESIFGPKIRWDEFGTDTRMEAKPLKEAMPEGGIPSTRPLSAPRKS